MQPARQGDRYIRLSATGIAANLPGCLGGVIPNIIKKLPTTSLMHNAKVASCLVADRIPKVSSRLVG